MKYNKNYITCVHITIVNVYPYNTLSFNKTISFITVTLFSSILFNYRAIKRDTLRLGLISIYHKLYNKPKSVIFDPLML